MQDEEKFISQAALLCEPARAKMLWNLLDGRAYTAGELAIVADVSTSSASNHLTKLLDADLVKVATQGRHRYFSFSRPEVAYVVESIASLAIGKTKKDTIKEDTNKGIRYCRSCYDHLAGYVGVQITIALEHNKFLKRSGDTYTITNSGWNWLGDFDINQADLLKTRRSLARPCLDWSERQPHLAGQVGALLLNSMLQKRWLRRINFSRELLVTLKGQEEIKRSLRIKV